MLSSILNSDLDQPWCDRDGETQRDLVGQARRIAAAIEAVRAVRAVRAGQAGQAVRARSDARVVLSCRHARSYVPGLLGAWLADATVELLPNVQPGTLDRVDADRDIAVVLHDVAASRDRSPKAIYVPAIVSEPGAANPAGVTSGPELAVVMTTSGTTERPKYVTKSMAQLVAELDVLATAFPAARCVLSTVPLSHLYGLLFGVLLPLRSGARIVSHDALLPADVAAVIEREAVDLMISTPAHLRAMASAAMPPGLRVISSGARLPPELHTQLVIGHSWQVTDVLGSTETGGIATRQHPMATWTPLPGVEVSAPDHRLVVASPWCGADSMALDDRIELRSDGTFQHLGRSTELVKIAGKRAHAHAIEATVLAIPGVSDAALIVHTPVGKEPRVALAICCPPGSPVARDAITTAISDQFDPVFAPRIVKVVARIPRSDRGKLQADALRELLGLDAAPSTNRIPARRVGPGQYAADIPRDLVFFRGHFDSYAMLPGAVLVERLVWPIVKTELPEVTGLRAIRRLRFRRPVFPDQQLSVTLKHAEGRVTFEVCSPTSVVASGQLYVD